MAQFNILSSINRSTTYPLKKSITATYNCGTFCLVPTGDFTQQMLCELPAVNIKIFTGANEVQYDFDINMSIVNDDTLNYSAIYPYSIPVLNIPQSFSIKVTPMFDADALSAHNNDVENGNIEQFLTDGEIVDSNDYSAYLWTTETEEFPILIYFDNTNIQAGGSSGGGGGGSDQASDIHYDNSTSGLSATNVQEAIDELQATSAHIVTESDTITLYSANWNNGEYSITNNDIKADSIIHISTPSTITAEQYNTLANANIICSNQTAGSVTLKAVKTVPEIDVPVIVTVQNIIT